MNWIIYTLPIISGLIGWVTNYVAIKMLFHPRKRVNFYIFQLQGVFPKRKPILAERLGRIVSRDLLSVEAIKEKLDTPENQQQIKVAIVNELEDYIVNKLKPSNAMLGMILTESVVKQIKERLDNQLETVVPRFTGKIAHKVEEVNLEQMVRDKVLAFSDQKLEDTLMAVINKELRFVEIAGGVLGFTIGLIQLFLMSFANGF
jgi:uncharacterized membrane protein YheB (UPF0754 family)